MRSEVTGDAQTAFEAAADALPLSRDECAVVQHRPDKGARLILGRMLIHQLEVEVEVGDRVPANVRTDEPSGGMGREHAGADGPDAGDEHSPPMPLHCIWPTEASRSV